MKQSDFVLNRGGPALDRMNGAVDISLALLFHELLQSLVDLVGHVVNFIAEDARSAQRLGRNFETSGRFEPFVPSSLLQSENCGQNIKK